MQENCPDFKIKIKEGGRVIIPSVYRKAMGIHLGDELVIRLQDGELRLFQKTIALKRLRATIKHKAHKINKGGYTADFLIFRKMDTGP